MTIQEIRTSIPNHIIRQHGTCHPSEPRWTGLNAARAIEITSSSTLLNSPSLPQLRDILHFHPIAPLTPYSPILAIGALTWKEIFHKDRPQKVADVLWKIAHHHLPVGVPVTHIAPDGPHCPWCKGNLNSISHLFQQCPIE